MYDGKNSYIEAEVQTWGEQVRKTGVDAINENCPQRSNMWKIVICNMCIMMTENINYRSKKMSSLIGPTLKKILEENFIECLFISSAKM